MGNHPGILWATHATLGSHGNPPGNPRVSIYKISIIGNESSNKRHELYPFFIIPSSPPSGWGC